MGSEKLRVIAHELVEPDAGAREAHPEEVRLPARSGAGSRADGAGAGRDVAARNSRLTNTLALTMRSWAAMVSPANPSS